MRLICSYSYRFFPVGQGLFAAGSVTIGQSRRPYNWVYDCGTVSEESLVTSAISTYRRSVCHIDLLALSHFDEDHISGVTKLLSHCSVDTLMLPYIPLWQRIVLALKQGAAPGDDLMRFALDPAGYFVDLDARIERILFVLPSEGTRPPNLFEADVQIPPDDDGTNEPWIAKIEFGDDPTEDGSDSLNTGGRIPVKFLRPGGRLLIAGLWEFVPYNDQKLAPTGGFANRIAALSRELLAANNMDAMALVLNAMKSEYDDEFGDSGYRRNVISLFLYAGPLIAKTCPCFDYKATPAGGVSHHKFARGLRRRGIGRSAIIYTGDGDLKKRKFAKFKAFYQASRLDATAVFQVMHHGAKNNWCTEVSKSVKPLMSIFSSKPTLHHPHPDVAADFLLYGAVQVDKFNDAVALGHVVVF